MYRVLILSVIVTIYRLNALKCIALRSRYVDLIHRNSSAAIAVEIQSLRKIHACIRSTKFPISSRRIYSFLCFWLETRAAFQQEVQIDLDLYYSLNVVGIECRLLLTCGKKAIANRLTDSWPHLQSRISKIVGAV